MLFLLLFILFSLLPKCYGFYSGFPQIFRLEHTLRLGTLLWTMREDRVHEILGSQLPALSEQTLKTSQRHLKGC